MTQSDYDRVVAQKQDLETTNDNLRLIVISLIIAVSLAITAAFYYKNKADVNKFASTQYDSATNYVASQYDQFFSDTNVSVDPLSEDAVVVSQFKVKQAEVIDLDAETIPTKE